MSRPAATRLVVLTALVVFVAGLIGLGQMLTRERAAVTAVATPPPIREATPIELEPGERVCQDDVAVAADAHVVRLYSASPTPNVPRLRVTVRAPGWSTSALSPEGTGPGAGADGIYDVRIDPPPRSLLATVCATTAERRPAILAGSQETRVHSRSQTTVDGRPTDTRLGLVLLSGSPRSVLGQAKEILERAATFHPPVVGWLSLGLLALVVALVVPAAAVYAALRALREDDAAGG